MKESLIQTPLSDPKLKGQRLKRVRNLTNLTRQELCSQEDLKIDTLKGWEIGRHGGLTLQAAVLLCEIFSRYGVICSSTWLLQAEGAPPHLIADFQAKTNTDDTHHEDQQIKNEIHFLKQSYKGLAEYQLADNYMTPFYAKGDYVAGIEYTNGFRQFVDQRVIAKLDLNQYLVRTLQVCPKHKRLCLFSTINKKHDVHNPSLISLAPIIWHRRPIKKNQ